MATYFSPGSPRYGRTARELHLIDVENLLGGTRFSISDVALLKPTYLKISDSAAASQFFVGGSAGESCLNGRVGWGEGRATYAAGADGAERSLLEAVPLNYASRFDRLIIGSGDGYFASYAAMLRTMGTHVTVVCNRDSLAGRLRLAVPDVRFLPATRSAPAAGRAFTVAA